MTQKSSPKRQHEFDVAYMKMALAMSELSYAYKKKVGAVIVSTNDQVISQGFNGMPVGMPNVCEEIIDSNGNRFNYDDDPVFVQEIFPLIQSGKYYKQGWKLVTKDICMHAEANAITKCAKYNTSTTGGTLYVTLSPCINCAKLIVQAEISRVVYLNDYKDKSGIELLRKCGIIVEKMENFQ